VYMHSSYSSTSGDFRLRAEMLRVLEYGQTRKAIASPIGCSVSSEDTCEPFSGRMIRPKPGIQQFETVHVAQSPLRLELRDWCPFDWFEGHLIHSHPSIFAIHAAEVSCSTILRMIINSYRWMRSKSGILLYHSSVSSVRCIVWFFWILTMKMFNPFSDHLRVCMVFQFFRTSIWHVCQQNDHL